MTRTALWLAAPSVALAMLVLVPFHDKAFTMDDTVFLLEAEHALADPLHPTGFEINWDAPYVPVRLSRVLPTGPVMPWLLVPSVVAGGAEWVAHLVQLAFLALALVATVSLAIRLGLEPRGAAVSGLVLAATPAALAMAGTAMPDVPAMALGVAGLERLIAWKQQRRLHHALLATVLLGLAPLARSHLILLLGVGALLLVGNFLEGSSSHRTSWFEWLPLAAAPLLTGALVLLTRDPATGDINLFTAVQQLSSISNDRLIRNSLAFATHWVLALPLAIPWVLLRPSSIWKRWPVLLLAMVAGVLLVLTFWHPARRPLFVAPVAGLAFAVLWDVFADAWKRRDAVQLTLGLWLLVALPAAAYVHLPSKYLLASAPAAALLVARELGARRDITARLILGGTLVAGLALGVAILRADAAFADLGRRAAGTLIAPQVAAGSRVWYAGHWGFQWYAEKAGGRSLTAAPPYAAQGDLVVSSLNSEPGHVLNLYPYRTRLACIADHRPGGRVMSLELGAGFYSNAWGYLPWAWGDDVLDEFDVWRIDASPGGGP